MNLSTQAKSRPRSGGICRCLLASLVPGFLVLVTALSDAGRAPAIERAPPPRSAAGESFDILYLSDVRPVVIRLYVSRDGKPIQAEWERFADAAFALLDRNKNGVLDDAEAADIQPMLALLTSQPNRAFPATRAMNRANFGENLRKNGFGPLRINSLIVQNQNRGIRRGGMPSKEELDKLLVELLDTDKDGKISVAEFTAGVEVLSRLDLDENELVSVDEITRRPLAPFFFAVNDNQPPPSPGVELFPLVRKGADPSLARSLLVRYGPKPAGAENGPVEPGPRRGRMQAPVEPSVKRLTKKDLKLSAAAFDALDQDGDGELDTEELARFGQGARPELEFAIRLGEVREGARPVEVLRMGDPPVKATCAGGADVAIEAPGVRLDFLMGNSSPQRAGGPAFRANYLRRFKRVDRDGNGYLDRMEAANDPVFQRLFDYLDRDHDGKVFEKELIAALDELEPVAAAAAAGLLTIELNEAGTGLFGLIDADGDGRLSLMELRAMPRLVERFAADKVKGLSPSDVPRRFEAAVSLGGGFGPQRRSPRMDAFNGPPRPQVGPAWFQKMDRNRDGFVSRSEFLGTDEEFRKLDLDGDGLISVQEAEAAEKK